MCVVGMCAVHVRATVCLCVFVCVCVGACVCLCMRARYQLNKLSFQVSIARYPVSAKEVRQLYRNRGQCVGE